MNGAAFFVLFLVSVYNKNIQCNRSKRCGGKCSLRYLRGSDFCVCKYVTVIRLARASEHFGVQTRLTITINIRRENSINSKFSKMCQL